MSIRHAVIVAGPTASGKSALASALAERLGGTVINADAMQLYRELRILTARPSVEEEARVPHLLYGVRPAAEALNAAWWREAALRAMAEAETAARLPILCGGSGLYLEALVHGLSALPPVTSEARQEARRLLAELGPAGLHQQLARVDPETAARLRPTDAQRLARAWEVWRSSGRGLASFQATARPQRPDWHFTAIMLDPPRPMLREAIERRFAAMLDAGAVEEVEALLALGLDPALPAMRAHGVPELGAYLAGKLALREAEARAGLVTGQYAKRQATWFRHHELAGLARTQWIRSPMASETKLNERKIEDLAIFVRGLG